MADHLIRLTIRTHRAQYLTSGLAEVES